MIIVEDLEGVVTKLLWLAKVGFRAWIGMEVLLIDGVDHPLGPKGTGVVSVEFVLNPSIGVNGVVFHLVGNSNRVTLHGVVLQPS